jgi:hypothetical protein
MNTKSIVLAAAAVSCIFVSTQACSSNPEGTTGAGQQNQTGSSGKPSTPPSSGGSSGTANGGSSSGGSSSGGSSSGSSGSSGTTADSACAAKGDACVQCCYDAHPSGAKIEDNVYATCVCGAKGACQTECAKSDCSDDDNSPDSVDGDACDVCEQKVWTDDDDGVCGKQFTDSCAGDADCQAMVKCYDTCE